MVTVDGSEGSVRLGGSVRTWHERELEEMAAWAAPGVTHVVDNITIV